MLIIINGQPVDYPGTQASYEAIVQLAKGKYGDSVIFLHKREDGYSKHGTLWPRSPLLDLAPAMRFEVANTGNA